MNFLANLNTGIEGSVVAIAPGCLIIIMSICGMIYMLRGRDTSRPRSIYTGNTTPPPRHHCRFIH